MFVKTDNEHYINCDSCGKPAVFRSIMMTHNGTTYSVSYETHCDSITDKEHGNALGRAEAFYNTVFEFVDQFKALPESDRIVQSDNKGVGILINLDMQGERPSACNTRRLIIPFFTIRTFGKEIEIKLDRRELSTIKFDALLREAKNRAVPYIEEAKDRRDMGLE